MGVMVRAKTPRQDESSFVMLSEVETYLSSDVSSRMSRRVAMLARPNPSEEISFDFARRRCQDDMQQRESQTERLAFPHES